MIDRDWLILLAVSLGLGLAWGGFALRRSSRPDSRWEQVLFFALMAVAATGVYLFSSAVRRDEAAEAQLRAALAASAFPDREGVCGNRVLAEYPSPAGTMKLTVFVRDCGATTGFSTHISLIRSQHPLPAEGGNVFVADTEHGAAPPAPGGGPRVDVQWLSDERAVIRHHPAARVFKAEPSYDGISLEFRTDQ
jgi:hypothetical protein